MHGMTVSYMPTASHFGCSENRNIASITERSFAFYDAATTLSQSLIKNRHEAFPMRSTARHFRLRRTHGAAALLLALAIVTGAPVRAAQALPTMGSVSASASSMRGAAPSSQFHVRMRILSSCQVFVTSLGEVRSNCSYAQTPAPLILAITSMRNSPVSDQVREYSVTF